MDAKPPKPSVLLQQAGLLTAIPCVLLVGPGLGYLIGAAIDRRWGCAPWGVSLSIIGLLASARATMQLIRQAQELTSQK